MKRSKWFRLASAVFQLSFDTALTPPVWLSHFISSLSSGLWLWRHPLSAEWVGEHHHCAAATCAGKRGSCQVQLIHCSLLRQHSFGAHPHCDIYSRSQKELSWANGSGGLLHGKYQFYEHMWRTGFFFYLGFVQIVYNEIIWVINY